MMDAKVTPPMEPPSDQYTIDDIVEAIETDQGGSQETGSERIRHNSVGHEINNVQDIQCSILSNKNLTDGPKCLDSDEPDFLAPKPNHQICDKCITSQCECTNENGKDQKTRLVTDSTGRQRTGVTDKKLANDDYKKTSEDPDEDIPLVQSSAAADADADADVDLPIDRGYAWVITFGCFLNVVVMAGYGKAVAVLFVEYIDIFQASVTKTTLFMAVMSGSYSIGSVFSMHIVVSMLGIRKTVLLGGTLYVLSMVCAIFTTSITFLICTHSLIIGISHSLIHGPGILLIGQYFKKKRAFAMSVAVSGVSLGGIIYPPLVRFLLDTYSLRGAMIILTGISMHMWIGGLLYRPLESFKKTGQEKVEEVHQPQQERRSLWKMLKQTISHLDFSLFKKKIFLYIASFCIFAIMSAVTGAYIPALAKEKGIPETEGALLLSIMNALDFVSRLAAGAIVSKKYIKVYNMMAIGLIVTGTATHFTSFYDSFALMVVFSSITGIFGSIYVSLASAAIVEFMGVEYMAKTLGFVALFQGISGFISHPILGSIRDATGSYTLCYNYIGACAYIGAILLLCAPLIVGKKNDENEKPDLNKPV